MSENQIIDYSITDAFLTALGEQYKEIPDANTDEGYAVIKGGIGEVRSLRTQVEKHRKALKADALDWGRKVDTEAKRITAALVALRNP